MEGIAKITSASHPAAKPAPAGSTPQHEQLVKQSQRLVSQTFFGTMLKQMRNSPFKSKIFDGGRGGEVFSSMLDQHLADRMAGGKSGKKLVNSMVKHIEPKMPEEHETRKSQGCREIGGPACRSGTKRLFQTSGQGSEAACLGRFPSLKRS